MSFITRFVVRKNVLFYLVLTMVVGTQTSCSQERAISFIPLPKMDFKGKVASLGNEEVIGIYKYFLIENAPEEKGLLIEKIKHYADSIVQNTPLGDESLDEYHISFYKKSDRTEEFIGTEKSFYEAQHDLTNNSEDYIASYEMINCYQDEYKKKWVLRIENPYREIMVRDECQ